MQSLFTILGDKNFDEPPEVASIKKFVMQEYKYDVTVLIRPNDIVVTSPSSGLISSLRMRSPELKRRCQISKRLVFRIG